MSSAQSARQSYPDSVVTSAGEEQRPRREGKPYTGVVLVHGNGAAFEVEFVSYDGHTVALLTLERKQVRPLQTNDIPHARALVAA